jgi:hypothetical protein
MPQTMTGRALAIVSAALSLTACQSRSSPAASSSPTAPVATKLAVSQPSYSFPTTVVGQTAQSSPLELSATGGGSLVIANITSSNPAEFTVMDAANCIGVTLVAGSSTCRVSVKFQPAAPGVRSSKIVATSNDGTSVTVDVFGSAIASAPSGDPGGGGDGGGSGGGGGGGGSGGGSGGTGSGGGSTPPGTPAGSFPQAPCVPNGTNGIVLTVVNTTPILVQLTMAGPLKVVFSLAPGDIQLGAIPPGNYVFTGETPSSPTSNFIPSSWAMAAGCDYLLQLVTTSRTQIALTR